MIGTNTKPTANGYYWLEECGTRAEIVHVMELRSGFVFYRTGMDPETWLGDVSPDAVWSGPVTPPEVAVAAGGSEPTPVEPTANETPPKDNPVEDEILAGLTGLVTTLRSGEAVEDRHRVTTMSYWENPTIHVITLVDVNGYEVIYGLFTHLEDAKKHVKAVITAKHQVEPNQFAVPEAYTWTNLATSEKDWPHYECKADGVENYFEVVPYPVDLRRNPDGTTTQVSTFVNVYVYVYVYVDRRQPDASPQNPPAGS